MKTLKKTGIVLLVILALIFIIPLFISTNYEVKKTTTMNVSKDVAFEFMKDFSTFEKWSPWSGMDPNIEVTLDGALGEVGSSYSWNGSEDVGSGEMKIAKITKDSILVDLNFKEPFEAYSPTSYILTEKAGQTEVSWYMKGTMPYPMNIFLLFMDMEEEIGKDFVRGLDRLKKELEK